MAHTPISRPIAALDASSDVTMLLAAINLGDTSAASRLFPILYDELRRLAGRALGDRPAGQTLQPTALVHEVFIKLVDQSNPSWTSRKHFMDVAAKAMRHVLVDHARSRQSEKRGGSWQRVTLSDAAHSQGDRDVDLLALDDALERLSQLNPRHARIVELRYFVGLSIEETAELVGLGVTTVKDDWSMARAWLFRELS